MTLKTFLSHFLAAYLGAGLFGGLVMSTFLPLSKIGIAYYAVTWPTHVYCAEELNKCAPIASRMPASFHALIFNYDSEMEQGQ